MVIFSFLGIINDIWSPTANLRRFSAMVDEIKVEHIKVNFMAN